jgi:hypothetical protein
VVSTSFLCKRKGRVVGSTDESRKEYEATDTFPTQAQWSTPLEAPCYMPLSYEMSTSPPASAVSHASISSPRNTRTV